jgi:hypothetical protein
MYFGELLERVYRKMKDDVVDGIATGGSATTIVDSTIVNKYTENKFKNWIAFISTTTDGLTPQNKYALVSAYVSSTGTATIATVTDSVQSGDTYAWMKGTIPLNTMIKLCGDGLRKLPRITYPDTSLTSANDTLNYTMPIATKGIRPNRIYLRNSDYVELETPNWEIVTAAGGSTETLIFKSQPQQPYTIVIEYETLHPRPTVYNSYISEYYHDELAVAACVEYAWDWKRSTKNRKTDMDNWQLAKRELAEAMSMFPVQAPYRAQKRVPITMFN